MLVDPLVVRMTLADTARELLEELDSDASAKFARYHDDPCGFMRDLLGIEPWSRQAEILDSVAKHDRVLVRSGHKVGKLLADETPVPTPRGWRRHGDLVVGDEVFDERGRRCRVTAVMPWRDRPLMRVTFEDGTHIDADEAHEWVVRSRELRKSRNAQKPPLCIETRQLFSEQSVPNGSHPDGTPRQIANFTVDLSGPLSLPDRELPLDPYLLGLWLGDGSTRSGGFTSVDGLEQAFRDAGFEVTEKGDGIHFYVRGLMGALREAGVLDRKHVPETYLWASEPQRRALLAGLLDSDGYCSPKGLVEFTTTTEELASGVLHLARSLGIKARVAEGRAMLRGRDCGPKWRVTWCSPEEVFRLSRKRSRLRSEWKHKRNAHRRMAITSIERLPGRFDGQCIEVDSPSHLYLAGPAMVPTHNSLSACVLALWFVATRKRARVMMTAPSADQVKKILWRELTLHYPQAASALGGDARMPKDPATGIQLSGGREIFGKTGAKVENMAGVSGAELLFIIDEASGVSDDDYRAIKGNTAGGAKMVGFSNPTRPAGWYYEGLSNGLWHTIHVSSEESPNVVHPERPPIKGLALPSYIAEQRAECGANYLEHPQYQIRVLGAFPSSGPRSIIGIGLIEEARKRWNAHVELHPLAGIELEERCDRRARGDDLDDGLFGPLQIGVDPKRFGDDECVIHAVRDRFAYKPHVMPAGDLTGDMIAEAVVQVARAHRRPLRDLRPTPVKVDGKSVGAAAVDALRRHEATRRKEIRVVDVDVSKRAPLEEKYFNLRSQVWFHGADWTKDGGMLPPVPELTQELLVVQYGFDDKNRLKVEKKDEIRKRLKRSPNKADAFLMAIWPAEAPGVDVDADLPEDKDPEPRFF